MILSKDIFKLAFLFLISLGFGQIYVPIDTADQDFRDQLSQSYEASLNTYLDQKLSDLKGKEKRMLKEDYEAFHEEIKKEILDGQFVEQKTLEEMVYRILAKLQKANPNLPKNFKVLISRDPSLNAFCLADGTLIVNMGLFYYLQNEDQIASVLSHEIAHRVKEHSFNAQMRSIKRELNNKSAIRQIKREKYNVSDKATNFLRNQMYTSGKERRSNELEADSLGFALYNNTEYNKGEFLGALDLMLRYDTIKPLGLKKETYRKYFDLPQLPFNEDWMKMEDFSAYDYSLLKKKFDEDSLSTHPEIETRMEKLKKDFSLLQKDYPKPEVDALYEKATFIAEMEQVPSLYFLEEYGFAVYLCLLRLQDEEDLTPEKEKFYKKWLGYNFKRIAEARDSYTLNRYVENLDPKNQSESYQQFLSFIWNLSSSDLKAIATQYK